MVSVRNILILIIFLGTVMVTNAQWLRSGSTLAFSQTTAMGLDGTGNVYSAGIMTCNTAFGTDTLFNITCDTTNFANESIFDIFLTKHNANGDLLWVRQFVGSDQNVLNLNAMDVDTVTGEVYLSGSFNQDLNFNEGGLLSNPDLTMDLFVAKISPDGTVDWAFQTNGDNASASECEAISINGGSIYLTGYFSGTINYGAHTESVPDPRLFIAKLGQDGAPAWFKSLRSVTSGFSIGVAIDTWSHLIMVAGQFSDSVAFASDTLVANDGGLLLHLDTLGNERWATSITTAQVGGIKFNRVDSTLYIGGSSDQPVSVDGTEIFNDATARAFLASYDFANDTVLWANEWRSSAGTTPFVHSIYLSNDGEIFVGGSFSGANFTNQASGNDIAGVGENGFMSLVNGTGSESWLQGYGGENNDAVLAVVGENALTSYAGGSFTSYIRVAGEEIYRDLSLPNAFILQADRCPNVVADMLSADTVRVCPGDSFTLEVSQGPGYTYQWFSADSLLVGETNFQYVATSEGSYYAAITSAGCTKNTTASLVIINDTPEASVTTISELDQCEGADVTLRAPFGQERYFWYADGVDMGLADSVESVVVSTSGWYHLETENEFGCRNVSDSLRIRILPFPSDSLAPTGNFAICRGDTVTMVADTIVGTSFQWFRNGQSLVNDTLGFFHATEGGRYTARVQNEIGCEIETLEDTVIVQNNPSISLNVDHTIIYSLCQGDSLVLVSQNVIGQTYQWLEGGLAIPGETSNSLVVKNTGSYQVFVANSVCDSISDPVDVVVTPTPIASVLSPDQELCQGEVALLEASIVAGSTYQWFIDGVPIAGANSPTYGAGERGFYQVEVTNVFGCSDLSGQVSVSVRLGPPASLSVNGSATICEGETVVISANDGANLSYQWYRDGTLLPGQTSISLEVSTTGEYQVEVQNSNNCTTVSDAVSILTVTPPEAGISVVGQPVTCEGEPVRLLADSGGDSYAWYRNNSLLAGTSEPTFDATEAGSYFVVAFSGTCSDTSEVVTLDLAITPLPRININSEFLSTAFYPEIQWLLNGQPIPGATDQNLRIENSGFYEVRVANEFGCTGTSEAVSFCLPLPELVRQREVLRVNRTAASYEWYFEGILIEGVDDPELVTQQSGEYFALTIDADGCRSRTPSVYSCIPYPEIAEDPVNGLLLANPSTAFSYQWYREDEPLLGEDLNVLIPDSSGTYYVEVTDFGGCTSFSEGFSYRVPLPLGIEDADEKLLIYPNPAQEILYVRNDEPSVLPMNVTIVDLTGKQVFNHTFRTALNEIDLTNLNKGVYTICLTNQRGEPFYRRFFKQ